MKSNYLKFYAICLKSLRSNTLKTISGRAIQVGNVLILVSMFFLASCSSGGNSLPAVDVFDKATSGNVVQVPLADICSSVEKIRIAEVPGNVQKVVETPDHYYITYANNVVHQYDRSGKFIQNIGNNGRGPGEYLSPRCINFLPDSSLYIFDYYTQKILKYSTGGKHLSSKEIMDYEFIIAGSVENNGKLYFFTNGNYTNIEYAEYNPADDSFKKLNKANRTMVEGECLMGKVFTFGKEPLYMYNVFNDTLFTFNNNVFDGKMLLRADDLKFTFGELASIENFKSVTASRINFNSMNVSDSYLFINYSISEGMKKGKSYLALYNLKTGEYTQNVEITSDDPAAAINNTTELFEGTNHGELIKVNYPEGESGIELIKYKMR